MIIPYAVHSFYVFAVAQTFDVLHFFCKLYPDIHCLISLSLNVNDIRNTNPDHFHSFDDVKTSKWNREKMNNYRQNIVSCMVDELLSFARMCNDS